MDKPFYVSTAIAYVNAPPHIGHALEFIQADVLARWHRMRGIETFFLTGTDEHGVKIYETAQEQGIEVQEFVDQHAAEFRQLEGLLQLSNDGFVRTSEDSHKEGVQKLWGIMQEQGDIYKGEYEGLYCKGCEAFLPEKDLDEEGRCPIHKKKPERFKEENYFFRLSKYSERIREAISTDQLLIVPQARKKEMLNIIGEGLHDVSFSRPKAMLPWGVDVPGDDSQVMYVWCDALSNYITGIGYGSDDVKFERYWPCDVHLIGKDILRFHAGIWIGMLMSAGIVPPRAVYVHGFVTSEGQKMSKSLGNVVDPLAYVSKYGTEALRYFLLREIATTDDGDFSHERFVQLYNSELANGFGNLVNRVLMMVGKYCEGTVPAVYEDEVVSGYLEQQQIAYTEAFSVFDLKKACEVAVGVMGFANKYIDEKKPWIMAKEGHAQLQEVMYVLLELLRVIALLFVPILPVSASKIQEALALSGGRLREGAVVTCPAVLFPRIEE